MKNFTQSNENCISRNLKRILHFIFFVLFFSQYAYSQTPTGVTISWSSEVGCQVITEFDDGHKDPVTLEDIQDANCIRVCESSHVVYTLAGTLGSNPGTIWNVIGGTLVSSTSNTCVVDWGLVGMGSLSFTLNTPTATISKTICFEKIIKPVAFFNVIPLPKDPDIALVACVDQTINFTNLSNPNGGTGLVPPSFWDFGDGTFSTVFEPTHIYTQPGTYFITLTVNNSCHCTASYRRTIVVSEFRGFDIECPGVVCEGQSVVYKLPEDVSTYCTENYNWSVTGGHITGIDNHNGSVTVVWDQVGTSGFGYLTFDPTKCELKCLSLSTIKVPIIAVAGTIQGDDALCVGEQSLYKLPQWPTTLVNWSIDGNDDGSLAEVVLSQQRNEVYVRPLGTGGLTLRATYTNTLLHCGGAASFYINVNAPIEIAGDLVVCNLATGNYNTVLGDPTNWTLTTNTGVVVATNVGGATSTFSHTYALPGNYLLSAGASGNCPAQQLAITVVPLPLSPFATDIKVLLEGGSLVEASSLEVCPNAPYTYSIAADPLYQYRWAIDPAVGTILGSAVGNQVSISFTGLAPASFRIYRESIAPLVCPSLPTTIPITIKAILATISQDQAVVCANSNATYSVVIPGTMPEVLYGEGESYLWTITPNTLGSITAGQGTKTVTVLWNNTDSVSTAALTVVIQKCTLTKIVTKSITVNPLPHIAITATPTTFCSGTSILYSLTSTNDVPITSGIVTWNFGGFEIVGTDEQYFSFTNFGATNIGENVTAYVTDANGCGGITNTANLGVTVLPGPPAALSLQSQFNAFCSKIQIDATVQIASATAGVTFEWFRDGVSLGLSPSTTSLHIVYPYYGFGSYYFVATNAAGCQTTSNAIQIVKFCPDEPCDYSPEPQLTNSSTQICGVLNLVGSATGTPQNTYWRIEGPPNVAVTNYTGLTYTAAAAGDFHVYYIAEYLNVSTGITCVFNEYKKVTVPYVPDFASSALCAGNSTFTVTLTDKTSFYAPVDNRLVTFFYRPGTTGTWISTGTTLPTLMAGSYQVRIVVQGNYEGVAQPVCEKIISITLFGIPNQNISITTLPSCYNSAAEFSCDNGLSGDSYLWTFEPGVIGNEATNTLPIPKRVFPTSGTKTVKVLVTNKFGCTREFTTTVIIPEKCFNGTVVSSPSPPTVCAGGMVTLSYAAGTIPECVPEHYVWMNGQNPILPAQDAPSIQVSTGGFYWVIVKKGSCTYETPNRIVPLFQLPPSVRLEGPSALCLGEPLKVKAITSSTVLRWVVDGNPQATANNQVNFSLYGLSLGNHFVSVTVYTGDPALSSSCFSTVTLNLTVFLPPNEPVITQQIVCEGDDPAQPYYHVILHASSNVPGVYNWSNGMSGSTITVLDGGPYQVRLTNGTCTITSQVDVPRNPSDYLWIFPSGCYSSCVAEFGQPSVVGPRLPIPEWAWLLDSNPILTGGNSFPETLPIVHSGTYNLTLNMAPCASTSAPMYFSTSTKCQKCPTSTIQLVSATVNGGGFCSFEVVLDMGGVTDFDGILVAPNDDFVVLPSSIHLSAGANQLTFTFIPLSTFAGGSVQLELNGFLADGTPCVNQFSIDLPSCGDASVSKLENYSFASKNASVVLAPNPANDVVVVRYENLSVGSEVAMYDLTGRTLLTSTLTTTDGTLTLATSAYPSGVYVVVVRSNGGLVSQQKLIIK